MTDYGIECAWLLLKGIVLKENENLNIEDEDLKHRKEQEEQQAEEEEQFRQKWRYPQGSSTLYCNSCNQSEYECQCDTPIPHDDPGPEPAQDPPAQEKPPFEEHWRNDA